jgi:hypothetical protein
MDSSNITIPEEPMRKKRNGPGQMLNVLAFIPQYENWFVKDDNSEEKDDLDSLFETEAAEPNIIYLNDIVRNINHLKSIKILETHKRVLEEIEKLCKGYIKTLKIEISLKIGDKRKGSLILKLKDDTIFLIAIEYTEDKMHKNLRKIKILLKKIMKIANGFWGTIGVEFDLLDKIDVKCLYDSLFLRGFEYGVWNNKIIYSWKQLVSMETKIVFGNEFHGGWTNREIIHWFLRDMWYFRIKHLEYFTLLKKKLVLKFPLILWFAFCIHSLIKNHRLPLQD